MEEYTPWSIYTELIDAIPADIVVIDFCIGAHWAFVEAECGMGISHVVPGGAHATFKDDPRSLDLKSLAALCRSWNFTEATLGIAALNAWFATAENVRELGGVVDENMVASKDAANPFKAMRATYRGKNIAVVGHFPNVESMYRDAHVTVLERACESPLDVPDSACEFILPEQDFVFMTGTTLTNKTAPRLLELSAQAHTSMVGPSAIPSRVLFAHGVDAISGSVVTDPEPAKFSIKGGTKQQWRAGIKKFALEVGHAR